MKVWPSLYLLLYYLWQSKCEGINTQLTSICNGSLLPCLFAPSPLMSTLGQTLRPELDG